MAACPREGFGPWLGGRGGKTPFVEGLGGGGTDLRFVVILCAVMVGGLVSREGVRQRVARKGEGRDRTSRARLK